MSTKKTNAPATVKWNHNEDVTPEEFIRRLAPLIKGPIAVMWDCEGDMFMSDFHKLNQAARALDYALESLDK